MKIYELWSKAGASPNYQYDIKLLSGLNWFPNWLQNHFLIKF